jgi:hypothetical protein
MLAIMAPNLQSFEYTSEDGEDVMEFIHITTQLGSAVPGGALQKLKNLRIDCVCTGEVTLTRSHETLWVLCEEELSFTYVSTESLRELKLGTLIVDPVRVCNTILKPGGSPHLRSLRLEWDFDHNHNYQQIVTSLASNVPTLEEFQMEVVNYANSNPLRNLSQLVGLKRLQLQEDLLVHRGNWVSLVNNHTLLPPSLESLHIRHVGGGDLMSLVHIADPLSDQLYNAVPLFRMPELVLEASLMSHTLSLPAIQKLASALGARGTKLVVWVSDPTGERTVLRISRDGIW